MQPGFSRILPQSGRGPPNLPVRAEGSDGRAQLGDGGVRGGARAAPLAHARRASKRRAASGAHEMGDAPRGRKQASCPAFLARRAKKRAIKALLTAEGGPGTSQKTFKVKTKTLKPQMNSNVSNASALETDSPRVTVKQTKLPLPQTVLDSYETFQKYLTTWSGEVHGNIAAKFHSTTFDVEKVRRQMQGVRNEFGGNWGFDHAIFDTPTWLVADLSQNPVGSNNDSPAAPTTWSPLARHTPYIKQMVESMGGCVTRVRINTLQPGGYAPYHLDGVYITPYNTLWERLRGRARFYLAAWRRLWVVHAGFDKSSESISGFWKHLWRQLCSPLDFCVRVHFVLNTNDKALIRVGNTWLTQEPGSIWWFDASVPHTVWNPTNEQRVIVYADVWVNKQISDIGRLLYNKRYESKRLEYRQNAIKLLTKYQRALATHHDPSFPTRFDQSKAPSPNELAFCSSCQAIYEPHLNPYPGVSNCVNWTPTFDFVAT